MIRAIQFQNKRVGSTFLQKALDSHPLIAGIDEVFVNVAKPGIKKSGFIPYVNTTYNGFSQPKHYLSGWVWGENPDKHVIFKLMYNQINHHRGLLTFIQNDRIPIIHLMRKNLLKQVISYEIQTKKAVTLTPEQLLRNVKSVDKLNKDWQKQITWKKLELYYEDIIGDTIDGFTFVSESVRMSLCEFFEIEKAKRWFCAATKKNQNDIWEYVNRGAVERKFRGTQYEWMIKWN